MSSPRPEKTAQGTPSTTARRAGRPVDERKVAALVEASWVMFLEHGVDAVSLEAVAARAGVSKATLYKHFPDKPSLFAAGIRREVELIERHQAGGAASLQALPLRERLELFGKGIFSFLFTDPAINFYGVLSGELRRQPELATLFYDIGPGRTRASLAGLLAAAERAGELDLGPDADAAEQAAEALFGLWQGFSNLQLLLGIGTEELRATLAERVQRGVHLFLALYSTVGRGQR